MRRIPFRILTTTCRHCGKSIATGSHSLTGADAAKAKYDRICADCVTAEEEQAMLAAQGQAIVKRHAK